MCYYKNNPRKCFYKLLIRLLFQTIKHYILSCLTIKICHNVCDPKLFTLQSQIIIHAWRDLIAVIFPIIIASLRRYFRISMLLFQYSFSLMIYQFFATLLFLHNIFIIQMNIWEGVDKVSYMMTLLRCLLFWFWGTDTLVNPLSFTSILWNVVSCKDKFIVFYSHFNNVMYFPRLPFINYIDIIGEKRKYFSILMCPSHLGEK